MKIADFAEKQKYYTGANSKVKWVKKHQEILKEYFQQCNFRPAILKDKLNTSYSTVKRFLVKANLRSLSILNNLGICSDNSQHRKFHGNLEKIAGHLVKLGYIKFNEETGYYTILEKYAANPS